MSGLTARANDIVTAVPTVGGRPLVLALAAAVAYFGARALRHPPDARTNANDAPPA